MKSHPALARVRGAVLYTPLWMTTSPSSRPSSSQGAAGGSTKEIRLTATVFGREPATYRAQVIEFDRRARARRAARISGLLLLGALVSLPIPAWHLAAVPGFSIAAIVLGARRLRQSRLVVSVAGRCPSCAASPDLPVPDSVRFPLTTPCPACGEYITLQEA